MPTLSNLPSQTLALWERLPRTQRLTFVGNLDAGLALRGNLNTTATLYNSLGVLNTVKITYTKVQPNYWAVSNSANNVIRVNSAHIATTGTPNTLSPDRWTITDDGAGGLTAQFRPATFAPPNTLTIPGAAPLDAAITGTIAAGGTNNTLIPGITLTGTSPFGAGGSATIDITDTVVQFDPTGQYVPTSPAVTLNLTNTNGSNTPQTVVIAFSNVSQ